MRDFGFLALFAAISTALAFAGRAFAEDLPDLDALWNWEDPAASEAKFRAMLPKAEAAGDADYVAELWTQIARTYGLRDRFDEAHAILDRVETSLGPKTPKARVRHLLERGRTFRSSKRPAEAKPLFQKAWDSARESGLESLACDAGHMMAITEEGDAAIAWAEKTIAYAATCKDPRARGWEAPLSYNLGWTYQDRGEHEKALALFRRDLSLRLERKRVAEARVSKWSVARALRSLRRYDEAMTLQRELEKEYEAAGSSDGYVFEEIAELLLVAGRDADAKPYFAKAYARLKDRAVSENIEASRIERLRTLGGAPASGPMGSDGRGGRLDDDLLESLVGTWDVTGHVGPREVKNRVTASWALQHRFVELHFEDVANSPPQYEAKVLIGYSFADKHYVAHWCDSFGGAHSSMGIGTRKDASIEFVFGSPTPTFVNTFSWDAKTATWALRLENVNPDGTRSLFATETMRRK